MGDNSDIMAYSSNMRMRVHSNHIPSKTMPISLPLFWSCKVCTFAENALDSPVCSVCGSLPPFEENANTKKQKQKNIQTVPKKKKKQNAQVLSPRAHQPNHHQHKIWARDQTRNRHGNHQRTVSAQISHKQIPNISHILPNFLEEDEDEKDSNQPSYLKKNSIANLVTRNNAISLLHEIPQNEQDLIVKQINKIGNKKDLQIELYSVKMTINKKIKKKKKNFKKSVLLKKKKKKKKK